MNVAKGTAHYEGEIEGEVEHFETVAEYFVCSGVAGVGCRADYYFEIREFVLKLFDEGFCRIGLSYTDGVQPDTFFVGGLASDFAESLCPAGAVAFMPDGPIYEDGAVAYRCQQIYKINQDSHKQSLQSN
jgi:hypothetical protein